MFIREDWKQFRNMDTLPQKAGVTIEKMGLLVAKELADNALDSCGNCEVGSLSGNGFYVKDNGAGIDINKLTELFSINRPLMSSKLLRLPTRGALGNGLRVVCGAVTSTNGKLYVSTKGRKYNMVMQLDGRTLAEVVGEYNEKGTKIEIEFGSAIRPNLSWAKDAIKYSVGDNYRGKTSGYWYTSEAFYELLQGHEGNVRDVINQFEGCTGTKAGVILQEYRNTKSNNLSFPESDKLLQSIRENSKKVKANRLGEIGELGGYGYYKTFGEFNVYSSKGDNNAEIPFVVEAWVDNNQIKDITVLVNKTPITGDIRLFEGRSNKMTISGCGIYENIGIKNGNIILNIITPYMPIISDGKEPDLSKFVLGITESIKKAGNRAKKYVANTGKSITQKDIILYNLEQAIAKASGEGEYRFSLRQLYYAIRPFVIGVVGKELEYGYFGSIITGFEVENGDITLMYRDDRGTLYHPHLKQDIPIGTIAVENYERPKWTFNKVLYIEKEGFFNVLKDKKIPEKYDMALLTSKGYASRAVKDLLDSMGEDSEEEIIFFCIHDADAAGTKIYDTLQNETKARPGRKVKIINLGLDPEEAVNMGLEVEIVDKKNKCKAVANYIEQKWAKWLQSKRVELNAMSTPQFLEWLEAKIQMYDKGKVMPPENVIVETMDISVKSKIGRIISDEILIENGYAEKVHTAFEQVKSNYSDSVIELRGMVESGLKKEPTEIWSKVVDEISDSVMR